MTFSWDPAKGGRAVCQPGGPPVNYAVIVPSVICTLLALALLAGLGWVWYRHNKDRLVRKLGPPRAPLPAQRWIGCTVLCPCCGPCAVPGAAWQATSASPARQDKAWDSPAVAALQALCGLQ